MTIESKQIFNFGFDKKNVDSIITDDEKTRIISFIKHIQDKLNISSIRYDVLKINQAESEQFFVVGVNAEKAMNVDKSLSNQFALSLAGYHEDNLKKMGNFHIKNINIFSSKTQNNKIKTLINTVNLSNINLLTNGIFSVLKRHGIKKIDIRVNVYYSMEIQNLYYDFEIKSLGTSIFDTENTEFSKNHKQKFTMTEFELENYVFDKKVHVKEFLYDFDVMNLKMFDKKDVVKKFTDVVEQLKLINY